MLHHAIRRDTGEEVIIKKMNKSILTGDDLYQLKNEIQVLKMTAHPNIVQMKDYFEDAENIYIVLAYIKGKDLFDHY